MALHWDITNVNDEFAWSEYDSETGKGRLDPTMHALIWATIGVGLRGITEENKEEFAARLDILQKLDGAYMTGPDGPHFITADDVKNRVGLKVNVADESRSAWIKRVMRHSFIAADRHAVAIKKAKLAKSKQRESAFIGDTVAVDADGYTYTRS